MSDIEQHSTLPGPEKTPQHPGTIFYRPRHCLDGLPCRFRRLSFAVLGPAAVDHFKPNLRNMSRHSEATLQEFKSPVSCRELENAMKPKHDTFPQGKP